MFLLRKKSAVINLAETEELNLKRRRQSVMLKMILTRGLVLKMKQAAITARW